MSNPGKKLGAAKKAYLKQYRQQDAVKEANKLRMREVYASDEGRTYEGKRRRTVKSRYLRGKCNAKRRGKVFSLTLEEYEILISAPCTYCNGDISQETGTGLDRIDNTKGYETGNVAPSCKVCNRIRKNSMSSKEFVRQTKLNKRRKE